MAEFPLTRTFRDLRRSGNFVLEIQGTEAVREFL